MGIFEAIILGVIQGLTEFLPVSSSGHLEIGKVLLGVEFKDNLLFSVLLHLATALSTIVVYRNTILDILKGIFKGQQNDLLFALKIFISMIPVGIVGLLFKEEVEAFFNGNIVLVGSMLLFTGTLLLITRFVTKQNDSDPTIPQGLAMGIAQAIAVLPGISRSGATIATGILTGVSREASARFSFLMVLPPILGASLLEFKDFLETYSTSAGIELSPLIAGFFAAFITGWLACIWMIKLVTQGRLIIFSIYCFIVGTVAIIASIL